MLARRKHGVLTYNQESKMNVWYGTLEVSLSDDEKKTGASP